MFVRAGTVYVFRVSTACRYTNIYGEPAYSAKVEVTAEEALNLEQVAREKGDGLLRLRDHDNSLCEACH